MYKPLPDPVAGGACGAATGEGGGMGGEIDTRELEIPRKPLGKTRISINSPPLKCHFTSIPPP